MRCQTCEVCTYVCTTCTTHVCACMQRPVLNMSHLPQLLSTLLRQSPLLNWSSSILDSLASSLPRRSLLSASQALDDRQPPHLPAFTWVLGPRTLAFMFAHQALYPQGHPIRPSYLVFLKKGLLMVLLRPDLTSNLLSPFRIKRGFVWFICQAGQL